MKLYGYWRSSSSYRVRIALRVKAIPYEDAIVNLLRGEQLLDGHRTRNPSAQVPVLELDDGRRITQSVAIIEYLEETYPQVKLYPEDSFLRARVRAMVEVVNSGVQPLQNLAVLQHLRDDLGQDERAWGRKWNHRGLSALEDVAKEVAGRYSVGDAVSAADVFLIPQLYSARRFDTPLDDFPTLLRVERACNDLAAFLESHPDRQVDAVKT